VTVVRGEETVASLDGRVAGETPTPTPTSTSTSTGDSTRAFGPGVGVGLARTRRRAGRRERGNVAADADPPAVR
jgi:hypothetical protein